MLRIEGQMKTNRKEPEMPKPKLFVEHPTEGFRVPVIEEGKNGIEDAADDDIVKMGDHKVRIIQLPIEGSDAQHDSGQSGNQELEQEGDRKDHWQFQTNLAAIHGGQPIEHLDAGWNGDGHGRHGKEGYPKRIEADR